MSNTSKNDISRLLSNVLLAFKVNKESLPEKKELIHTCKIVRIDKSF
jgi:uncharacterized protein YrrD